MSGNASDSGLVVSGLSAGYGESVVLEVVSFSLAVGGSLAVLGRNGTGKTTLLTTLMGLTQQHRGSIRCQGRELSRLSSYQRARLGLGWVPQERGVFPSLTVHEHLQAVARLGAWTAERVYQLFPSLAARKSNLGHQLVLRELLARGNMAVILVEQHAQLALALTEGVIVLDRGRIAHAGSSAMLASDVELQRRLLALA